MSPERICIHCIETMPVLWPLNFRSMAVSERNRKKKWAKCQETREAINSLEILTISSTPSLQPMPTISIESGVAFNALIRHSAHRFNKLHYICVTFVIWFSLFCFVLALVGTTMYSVGAIWFKKKSIFWLDLNSKIQCKITFLKVLFWCLIV